MPEVDSTIYLDTDILVVTDLYKIWKEFDRFTSKQMLGATPEHEVWNNWSYYTNTSTRTRYPFVQPSGINSGVLLMNLTRMRDFSFFKKIDLIYQQYKDVLFLQDQDLLNIIGYYNPGY